MYGGQVIWPVQPDRVQVTADGGTNVWFRAVKSPLSHS